MEVLTFVEGEVPQTPEPPDGGFPVASDRRVASIGDLLRRFHRAATGFVAPPGARWQGGFTPGCVPSVVCHNDPVVGNVVFSSDRAIALIDFDFAGPNDPLRDLAIAAQHWVPLADPKDLIGASPSWSPTERLLGMADSYALPREKLGRVLDLVDAYLERGMRVCEHEWKPANRGSSPIGKPASTIGSRGHWTGFVPSGTLWRDRGQPG